jgi:hypothetical protein
MTELNTRAMVERSGRIVDNGQWRLGAQDGQTSTSNPTGRARAIMEGSERGSQRARHDVCLRVL